MWSSLAAYGKLPLARMRRLRVRFFHWIGCQRVCACHLSRLPVRFSVPVCSPSTAADNRQRRRHSRRLDWLSVCSSAICRTAPLKPTCARTSAPSRRRRRSCCRSTARPAVRAASRSSSSSTARTPNEAIQKFNGQVVQRPAAVGQRSARARGSRPRRSAAARRTAGPRPGRRGFSAAPAVVVRRAAAPFDSGGARRRARGRSRNFGPDAKPQRGGSRRPRRRTTSAARSDSGEERRPLLHARRRLAGRVAAGFRRLRDEQA